MPEDPIATRDGLVSEDEADTSANDDAEPAADLMVVSRARRSNAGNRMSTLLAQEDIPDEEEQWGEDWEELPNEEEFVGDDAEDQGDFNLDSSSSEDEDEGAEDDAGEKELRRVERQERDKKRKKAANPFAAGLVARKRVKINIPLSAPTESTPAPRPKKKSERACWLPTPEDGPVRQSSRRQTVMNKNETTERLLEKSIKRKKTIVMMEMAAERKQKVQPKAMTQEEKLAEAALVEKQNSKSLHRWEEAEEKRAAERKAKLDALKSRELEGPFIRYYSGPAIWIDGKLKYTGKDAPKIEELVDQNADEAVAAKDMNIDTTASEDVAPTTTEPTSVLQTAPEPAETPSESTQSPSQQTQQQQQPTNLPPTTYPNSIIFAPPQNPNSFLFGVEHWASTPDPVLASPTTSQPLINQPQPTQPPEPVLAPPIPHKTIERAVRNLIILTSFPSLPPAPHSHRTTLTTRDKPTFIALTSNLFAWPTSHATLAASLNPSRYNTKNSSLPVPAKASCAITGLQALYKDPATGLAYRDKYAYSRIRRLVEGDCRWSKGLGCYVGPVYDRVRSSGVGGWGRPARGVPERFWGRRGECAGVEGGEGKSVQAKDEEA